MRKKQLVFFIGLIVLVLALLACGESTSATQAPTPTLANKLASLDAGHDLDTNDPAIAKYQTLLDSLHKNTGDSEQDISDETVKGQQMLHDKGQDVQLIDLLKAVNKSVTSKSENIHYNEALAGLIVIMTSQK